MAAQGYYQDPNYSQGLEPPASKKAKTYEEEPIANAGHFDYPAVAGYDPNAQYDSNAVDYRAWAAYYGPQYNTFAAYYGWPQFADYPPAVPMHQAPSLMQQEYAPRPELAAESAASAAAVQAAIVEAKKKKNLRSAGGDVWEDKTLAAFPENDYRVFIGNLGNEVNEDHLKSVFGKYSSFAMVRVIRSKNGKTKGFGFLSFMDPNDYMRAIKEWTGKYIGSRPVQLRKSDWKERDLAVKKTKQKEDRKRKRQLGLA